MKSVSIITINYNQAAMTIECVDSILDSDYEKFIIYLIDNGSREEDYLHLVNYYTSNLKVNISRITQNIGYVGGVNQGFIESAKFESDYYLIMNNDTIIEQMAIKELVSASLRHENQAIITGTVLEFDNPDIIQTTGSKFTDKRFLKEMYPFRGNEILETNLIEEERDMADDIFWLIPKEIFNVVGPYPNCYFLYAEQADYALQVKRKGFKLMYTPKAKIWHKGSVTTGAGNRYAPPVNFWRNKSSTIYLFRNILITDFVFITTKRFLKLVLKNIINIFKPSSKERKSDYAALVGLLSGLGWIAHRRPDNGFNPFIK